MSRSIALVGTLDTKGDQVAYLKQEIEARGHRTTVVDIGVIGAAPFSADIGRGEVAEAAGSRLADVIALSDSHLAMTKMAAGAAAIVRAMCSRGELAGIVALGGSQGTSAALTITKAAPLGLPKLVISTVAYSPLITPDLMGGDDVMMIPWTAGLWGLNSISRAVIETAAGAIAGAADAYNKRLGAANRIVGLTSLGGAVNKYMAHLKPALEQRGYEAAVFHVTGMSGRLYERAIGDGLIAFSLDLAAGIELLNLVADGACSAGGLRLEAAGRMGIPQVVSPGAIEAFHWGKDRPLLQKYHDRPRHQHSALILTVRSGLEEIAAAGRLMAEKLNAAKGPTAVVLPMLGMIGKASTPALAAGSAPLKGVAAFRKELMSITLPGMQAFREALLERINPHIEVVTLDAGFNDSPYAETVLKLFDAMRR